MASPDLGTVLGEIEQSLAVKQRVLADDGLQQCVLDAGLMIANAFKADHKLLLAGNGGSAADAQHIASEFVGQFSGDRPGLPAMALTTDTSILTSVGNDYGFRNLFSRQVETAGQAGDVFLGISTSGSSENILQAMRAAREGGVSTIGLTGQGGGSMDELCDLCIRVPSEHTPRIQEVHILLGHILCTLVEQSLFGKA